MNFEIGVVTFLLVQLKFPCSGEDDVVCKIQLNERPPQPPSSSSSLSSSSSSSPMITALSATSGQNVQVTNFQSNCTTKNNQAVPSEVSGFEKNGFLCVTFACPCNGSSLSQKMATCHEVTSHVMKSSCHCCSQENALCVWEDEQLVTMTILNDHFSQHQKKPKPHDDGSGNYKIIDHDESGEPLKPYYLVIFIAVGLVIIGIAMAFFVIYKLKYSGGGGDDRYFAIAHIYSSYSKLQKYYRYKGGKGKNVTPPLIGHCGITRTRSLSYNGGKLANDPIKEVDEDDIEP